MFICFLILDSVELNANMHLRIINFIYLPCTYTSATTWSLISIFLCTGDDAWRYVGKLSDAQKSMLDDRFKWKVSIMKLPNSCLS